MTHTVLRRLIARLPGRRARVSALLTLLVIVSSTATAGAQVLYGSIVGNVTDSTGGALPGAAVVITHQETRRTRETLTNAEGYYTFTAVQTGTYTVAVTLQGFRTFTRPGVMVTLNSVARVNAALPIGALAEAITVSAESPALQTDRSELRHELRAQELQDLPVAIGRNYQDLFRTLPGFSPPEDAHSAPSNPSRALTFNVNGTSNQGNNTRIDGVSSTNIWLPHVVAYVPALEAIETVNVVTNNFDAEQGLAGGAAINVQIKSGTNRLRGSAYEYNFNERMRASNYFTPAGTTKGKWRENQYGGTLGGPIRKNKVFFFAAYEGTRQYRNVPRTISVPTAAVRRGDFSGTGATIYDPLTGNADGSGRTAFPGNVIPQDRISPVAKKIIPYFPLPNLSGDFNNHFVQPMFLFNRWTLDSKVNWNASQRLQLFGRYSQLDFLQDSETVLGPQLQGDDATGGGNPGRGWGDTYNVSAGMTYTLGSSIVVDSHFGWVRMNSNVEMSDVGENKGRDWLGIPGTNGPNRWEGGMPFFDLDGYTDFGTVEDFMPYYRADDQYQAVANLNWSKGKHNIRFGSDLYYTALNHIQPEISDDSFGARGGFEFNAGPSQLRGTSSNNYQSFASFLLGLPSRAGRLKLNVAPYTTRSWQYSFYVRDQWQISPKMTISFGTRYEYFPIPTRADRGLERYDLQTNLMQIGGLGSVRKDLGVSMQKNLFAPRAGAAYRLGARAVLRGGFGITNDPYSLSRSMRTNHPVLLNVLEEGAHSLTWIRPIEEGISAIPDPDLRDGIIPVPGNVTVITVPDKFERGRVWSWNLAYERELKWGFVGEAAYVGTRQIDQLGQLEQNYATIGGGSAGRQMVARFGRTAPTILIGPVGNTHYNALQTRLSRRLRWLFHQRQLHARQVDRHLGCEQQRSGAVDQDTGVLSSEPRPQRVRSPACVEHPLDRRVAVRQGTAMAERRRRARRHHRRVAGEQHPHLPQRQSVHRHRFRDVVECARQHADGRSGEGYRRDSWRDRPRQLLLRSVRVRPGDRGALWQRRLQHPGGTGHRAMGSRRLPAVRRRPPQRAAPRGALQRHEYAAIRQPRRQPVEPAAEPRRHDPQPQWIYRGDEYARAIQRAPASTRAADRVLIDLSQLRQPRRRIAAVVVAVFLASDASSFMTGSSAFVDGGWTAR